MMISIAWQQAAREPSAEAGQAQRITRRASSGSSISSGGTAITGQKTREILCGVSYHPTYCEDKARAMAGLDECAA